MNKTIKYKWAILGKGLKVERQAMYLGRINVIEILFPPKFT